MSEVWVLNASPLILFSRIKRLDIIDRLANPVLVPDAVIEEVRAGEADDPFTSVGLAFAQSRRASNLPVSTAVAHWDLGAGESQVIAHAIQTPAWAVLDDLAARRCAATYQISVIGSLGIVLRAKRKGIVEAAAPWISALKQAGMYVDSQLVERVLASIGESSQ